MKNLENIVKKVQRTKEHQEYRDNLANGIKNMRKKWVYWKKIAQILLEQGKITPEYIDDGKIDIEMVEKLVEDWYWDYVAEDLDDWIIKEQLTEGIAEKLIVNGQWYVVGSHIDKFEWLNHRKIAEELLEWWDFAVIALIDNIDKFKWLDHKKIAESLIEKWFWWFVAKNINKFEWLNHSEIAEKIIAAWNWSAIANYLEKFEWLNHKEIAESLLNQTRREWEFLAYNFYKFKWLDQKYVAKRLIQKRDSWARAVADSIQFFDKKCHKKVAIMLIDDWYLEYLIENLDKFEWLDEDILKILIRFWYLDVVKKYLEKFSS